MLDIITCDPILRHAAAHYNMRPHLITRGSMYKKNFGLGNVCNCATCLAKSLSVSGASCPSAFMGNCPAISHTCWPYLLSK